MRVPFDSLVLAAVVHELRPYVGAKVQRIVQPEPLTIMLGLYAGSAEAYLLLSCDPLFYRAHLTSKRPSGHGEPPAFCMALRSRLEGGRVVGIEQMGFDRVLALRIDHPSGANTLIAELMGKHSNLILIDEDKKIVAAAKSVGPTKSKRPVTVGRPYQPPPFEPRPSLLDAGQGDDLKNREGSGPFLLKIMAASDLSPAELKAIVKEGAYAPVLSPGNGAYPLSIAALDFDEHKRESISIALEQHHSLAIPDYESRQLKTSLLAQLHRVLLAREVALNELRQAEDTAARAGRLQLMGELILAYGHGLEPGAKQLEAEDYEGKVLTILLDPELDHLANSNRYFEKAKRAKAGIGTVKDQIVRIERDHLEISSLMAKVEQEERLVHLKEFEQEAKTKRWLHSQPAPSAKKEDRPYEGHKIRELLGPQGLKVFYGETATANDYLTLRVAKPNDYWLHVRGSVSAHVVVATNNKPEKVSREALEFAAKIAVAHSPSKHSGFVPVDYTLKKYVRKPKGAPLGTAFYTHEKTLHVEP